jgi:hypothetical protein
MYETAIDRPAKAPRARLPLTPARRVVLWLGVPLCLVIIANTAFSLVAELGRAKVALNYPIPVGARQVKLSLNGGDVVLRQIGGSQGRLTGTGTYSIVRPHITEEYTAGVAQFGYRCPIPFGDCGINATVSVPVGAAASISTNGGNITADGITGDVSLATGGGDVTASGVAGDLSLTTDGGNIEATGVTAAQVSASTLGGDVTIVFTKAPTNVRVNTDGGNITIVVPSDGTQYDVTAHANGGTPIEAVPMNSHSGNVITATSSGGDITIRQES